MISATLLIRSLLFPLVISTQRHAAKLAKVQPNIQALQQEFTQARQIGDHDEGNLWYFIIPFLILEKYILSFKYVSLSYSKIYPKFLCLLNKILLKRIYGW